MAVWVIRGGREGKREELCLRAGVTIIGWYQLDSDLSEVGSQQELRELMTRTYPSDWPPDRIRTLASQAYHFVNSIEQGDFIIMPRKGTHLAAVGVVDGPYEQRTDLGPENVHTRRVNWLRPDVPDTDLPVPKIDFRSTVTRVSDEDAHSRLEAFIAGGFHRADPTRYVHLLLRWRVEENPSTVLLHKQVADSNGSVWWGKLGDPETRRALSEENLSRLQQQVEEGIETHVYLYRSGEAWQTRLLEATTNRTDVDEALVPEYYGKGPHHLWVRLSDFKQLDGDWPIQHLVLDSDPSRALSGALAGQAALFLVKEVETLPESAERYFILLQRGIDQHGYLDEEGVRYTFDRNVAGHRLLQEAQVGRFVYYRPGRGATDATARTFFGRGRITGVEETTRDGQDALTATFADYIPFSRPVALDEFRPPRWNHQHSISEVTKEVYEELVRRGSVPSAVGEFDVLTVKRVIAVEPFRLRLDDAIIASVVAALRAGKHVVLTGPPGTAKTTLAQALAEVAKSAGMCRDYMLTTATADWTTYETIGGLRPTEQNRLSFADGHFLAAIRRGDWLVIDELNRSNFDRAFGQLFTVLSGQPVTLPYEDAETHRPLAIVPDGQTAPAGTHEVRVPASWRVIATMNVFDKSLLFEMSFALMRRFAFIEVGAPPDATYLTLVSDVTAGDDVAARVVHTLLSLRRVKELGPAMFMDVGRYVVERRAVDPEVADAQLVFECFYSYLLPQFEGIDDHEAAVLYGVLKDQVADSSRLKSVLVDVLGVERGRLTGSAVEPPQLDEEPAQTEDDA